MSALDLQFITPDWPAPPGVQAAFTLRTGGVSVAPYDSLNLGASLGDSPGAVAENRRRVRKRLRLPAEPIWLEQVHGTGVVELGAVAAGVPGAAGAAYAVAPGDGTLGMGRDGALRDDVVTRGGPLPRRGDVPDIPPIADAAIARHPGFVCAIRVADCMPVLFAAHDGSAVGAAHAGWRGLAGGVLEATMRRLDVPAPKLIAWMGPAIGPSHFEVGDDVRAAFVSSDGDSASAFAPNARGRWQCDLYALARRRLNALGVSAVYGGGWCTFAEADRFFSYRRDGQCGRMAALTWIDPRQS